MMPPVEAPVTRSKWSTIETLRSASRHAKRAAGNMPLYPPPSSDSTWNRSGAIAIRLRGVKSDGSVTVGCCRLLGVPLGPFATRGDRVAVDQPPLTVLDPKFAATRVVNDLAPAVDRFPL